MVADVIEPALGRREVVEEPAGEGAARLMVAADEHEGLRAVRSLGGGSKPAAEELVLGFEAVEGVAQVHEEIGGGPIHALQKVGDAGVVLMGVGDRGEGYGRFGPIEGREGLFRAFDKEAFLGPVGFHLDDAGGHSLVGVSAARREPGKVDGMERPDGEEAGLGVVSFVGEGLAREAVDDLGVARRVGQPDDRRPGFGERGDVRPLHDDRFRVVDDEGLVLGGEGEAEGESRRAAKARSASTKRADKPAPALWG